MCYYILLFATVALALFEPRYAESPLLLGVILYRRVRLRAVHLWVIGAMSILIKMLLFGSHRGCAAHSTMMWKANLRLGNRPVGKPSPNYGGIRGKILDLCCQ